jgi:hypothetical protein
LSFLKLTDCCKHCCSWQYMPLDSLKAIPASHPPATLSACCIGNHSWPFQAVNAIQSQNIHLRVQLPVSGFLITDFQCHFVCVFCSSTYRRVGWFRRPYWGDPETKKLAP